MVSSGIFWHVVPSTYDSESYHYLLLEQMQSQFEVEAVGHQAVSLKNHPWQIADNGIADNAT